MARRGGSPAPRTPNDAASEAAGIFRPDGSDREQTVAARLRPSERMSDIARLDAPALRAAWATLFGRPPPKSLSRRLLEYAASYLMQAKIHGGLKPAVRRRLLQAAGSRPGRADGALRRKRPGALTPGSRLVREWQGRCHTVEVAEDGFLYAGRHYRSLSAVARTITGARWSGPRFFAL
jgi:DUF2924 family protein